MQMKTKRRLRTIYTCSFIDVPKLAEELESNNIQQTTATYNAQLTIKNFKIKIFECAHLVLYLRDVHTSTPRDHLEIVANKLRVRIHNDSIHLFSAPSTPKVLYNCGWPARLLMAPVEIKGALIYFTSTLTPPLHFTPFI